MTYNKQTAHSTPIFADIQLLKIDDIRQLQVIPSHIREASSPSVFKNNLKKYFLTQYDST